MAFTSGRCFTYQAGADLPKKRRVKVNTAGKIELAGAGELDIGITEYAAVANEYLAVRPSKDVGVHEMTADAQSINIGDTLYPAAEGRVSVTDIGVAIGYAKQSTGGIGGELIGVERV